MCRLLKKLSALIALMIFTATIGKLWHVARGGFRINRITYELPRLLYTSEHEEQTVIPYLQGTFRYLGRGRQCYAFESEDKAFVLKIPRFDRYFLPIRWKVPLSFLETKRAALFEEKQKRLAFTLKSFEIASKELAPQTAILYSHFFKTQSLPSLLIIQDRLGRSYRINPNKTPFILQEKKELMIPQFLRAVEAKDEETIDRILGAFLDLIEVRATLGIFNKDPSFIKNFGWDGEKAIQIDVGSFYRRELDSADRARFLSMIESCYPMRNWLIRLDPALLKRFDCALQMHLDQVESCD